MAARPSPTRAIPGPHQLASMKRPRREFSAGSDVEAPKLDIPGPMYRLSEWRFERPFKSDAKMFFAGPLATFMVGLVGYVLSMTALILTAIMPGVIPSRTVAVPEQYREAGNVIRASAGLKRESSHSERWKRGAVGVVVSSSFGNVVPGEGGLPDNLSLGVGPSEAPAGLAPHTTPESGAQEDDNNDAAPRASSRPRSFERSITAPLTAMLTMNHRDDAGPSMPINRPQFIHKSSSLRRTLRGFKDAMHVRRRQPSEMDVNVHMRSTSAPSPFTTDDEGASYTESRIQCPSPSPTELSLSCSSQSPSESSYPNSTNRNKLRRNNPFMPRLGLSSSPNKQQSSSSPSICPLSSQKQPKIKPPPLRTTYTYTFLPTSEDPYEEGEPDERLERASPSPSPTHPDPSSSSYPRPFIGRSTSLPRGKPTSAQTSPTRNRFPSDPMPVFTPLSPSAVSPALVSITASRQEALLALEGKGKGKGQGGRVMDPLPVSVPVSITVATTSPVQQHQEQMQAGKESKRCRRMSKFRFVRGSSTTAISVTDDESAGAGVDEFGVLRDSVKRNSLPVAGKKERLVEDGSQLQQRQQHRRTGSLFGFGSGSGSKPPVSGTKRRTWKGISFS